MNELTIPQVQADLRQGDAGGAPGILESGTVWLIAGLVALSVSTRHAVRALLAGGVLIHPASVLACKALGRSGSHQAGNPFGRLAGEGTLWMLAAIAIAYGMHMLQPAWFFPAMPLIIGGRYLTFQTLYGMRIYGGLGAALCAAGLLLALLRAPVPIAALAGAAIVLVLGAVVFAQARGAGRRPVASGSGVKGA